MRATLNSARIPVSTHFRSLIGAWLGAALCVAALEANSATVTWTGAGGNANWTTAANWGGAVPISGDDLVFPAAVANTSTVNDFPAGTAFASLRIANAAYTFGGNALRLTTGVTTSYASGTALLPLAISLPASASFTIAAGGTLRLSGVVSDGIAAGGITKNGSGALELTGANTFTGATVVQDGTLRLANGAGSALRGSLTIGDGSGSAGSAIVIFGAASQLALNSAVTIRGDGSLQLDGYDQELLATLELTGGEIATGSGQLTFAAELPDVAMKATSAMVDGVARAPRISGNLRLGSTPSAGMIHVIEIARGPAAIDLDLAATVTGNHLNRRGAGVLQLGGSAADNTFRSLFALDGLTLLAKTGHYAVNEMSVGSDVDTGTVGSVRLLAREQINPAKLLHVSDKGLVDLNGFDQTLDDVVFRGGLLSTGSGTLTLRNSVSNSVMFQEATGVLKGNVNLNGGEVTFFLGKTLGAGIPEILVDGTMTNGSVTVDLYPVATHFGMIELRGAQTYTGGTRVVSGAVIVNGSLASAATLIPGSDPDRQIEAILSGTGSIAGVVTSTGGTISPGNGGPGILRVGGLALDPDTRLELSLSGPAAGTQYDQLDVTGTVNLGNAKLTINLGYVPEGGTSFTIIRNDGTDPVVGSFAGLPEGSPLLVENVAFYISYRGGDGNDVVLTTRRDVPAAIPTLGTWTLAATSLLLAIAGLRLRRARIPDRS